MHKENAVVAKERLLNQAEALFAQKGYHAVTVREITEAAKCNLAAVNYHFGNKRNLYLEVSVRDGSPGRSGCKMRFETPLQWKMRCRPKLF